MSKTSQIHRRVDQKIDFITIKENNDILNNQILEIYFKKSEDDVKAEYLMLYNSGNICTVDYDLKLLVLLYTINVTSDIFTDYEIAVLKLIVVMRNSSINFNFNTIYPIIKSSFKDFDLLSRESRIKNIQEIKDMSLKILFGSSLTNVEPTTPVTKNHFIVDYYSPVSKKNFDKNDSDNDTLSTLSNDYDYLDDCSENTVYCEFNC